MHTLYPLMKAEEYQNVNFVTITPPTLGDEANVTIK
jgi:hypothetical protein